MNTQEQKRTEDHDLAATAVNCLARLAHRYRNSKLYEVFAHVRDGAALVETLVIPDQRGKADDLVFV